MVSRITLICSLAEPGDRFPGNGAPSQTTLDRGSARVRALSDARACLTSPLSRAVMTAQALRLDALADPDLRELDYGGWAGLEIKTVLARFPEACAEWLSNPGAAPHGGESHAALAQRIAAWLERQAASRQSLIAVTHPGPIQAAVIHILGAPLSAMRQIAVKPLSRTRLSHDGRRWSVVLGGQESEDLIQGTIPTDQ